jgi:serine/threonine-protein kinase RIO1
MNLSHIPLANSVAKMEVLETHKRTRDQGWDDRATMEQNLDPRTRMISLNYCPEAFSKGGQRLSTWKGSQCLLTPGRKAKSQLGQSRNASSTLLHLQLHQSRRRVVTEYAIKIYKTSILVLQGPRQVRIRRNTGGLGYCKVQSS